MKKLVCPPNREYNLYLANYLAHVAKRRVAKVVAQHGLDMPAAAVEELRDTLKHFKVLDDLENPK